MENTIDLKKIDVEKINDNKPLLKDKDDPTNSLVS